MLGTKKGIGQRDTSLYALYIVTLFIIILFFFVFGNAMYSSRNIQSLAYQIPEFGFVALGMMFSFMLGGIDLSIIANANLSGILAANILMGTWAGSLPESTRIILAVLVAITASIVFGAFNGILITRFGVPSLIATLGTMTLYSGIGMAVTGGKSLVGFPQQFTAIGISEVFGIPVIFIIFSLIAGIMGFLVKYTVTGRRIYLMGTNPVAARFSGIDNDTMLLLVFMLTGLLGGLSGLTIISRVNSAKVGYGDAYLLQALIICVIGGIHPEGGRGRVVGVLVTIALMQMMSSAFTILQLSPFAKKLIWGSMLILVMGLTKEGPRIVASMKKVTNRMKIIRTRER
jgi:simple sugar transport system permease protein